MDGLTYNIPMTDTPCIIRDWTTGMRVKFKDIAGESPETKTSKTKKKGK